MTMTVPSPPTAALLKVGAVESDIDGVASTVADAVPAPALFTARIFTL